MLDHVGYQQHVRAVSCIYLEPLGHVLAQYRGCEWTEALTVFYLEIKRFLHGHRARIRENRARAGPNSIRALEPAERFHRLDRRSRESIPYTAEFPSTHSGIVFLDNRVLRSYRCLAPTPTATQGYRRPLPRATLANLLSWFLRCSGLLSHLRSCERYDEPETLPYSIHPVCPMSADGGQLVDHYKMKFSLFPSG